MDFFNKVERNKYYLNPLLQLNWGFQKFWDPWENEYPISPIYYAETETCIDLHS